MNKQRRQALEALKVKVEELKSEIESVQSDEQETFDNMPEGLQSGNKGDKITEAIEALGRALSNLDDVVDELTAAAE